MIAVLTGDIVGSQALSSQERSELPAYLKEAAEFSQLSETFEVFSGDSWQALCQPPHLAVAQALFFRAFLYGTKGIKTRVSIGIGHHETLHPEKISLSQGEAFWLSGQGLEGMQRDRQMDICISDQIPTETSMLLSGTCLLLDVVYATWTQKQAHAVALTSKQLPQNELAKQFDPPISPQAFGKHLASANWPKTEEALHRITFSLQRLFSNPI